MRWETDSSIAASVHTRGMGQKVADLGGLQTVVNEEGSKRQMAVKKEGNMR